MLLLVFTYVLLIFVEPNYPTDRSPYDLLPDVNPIQYFSDAKLMLGQKRN